MLTRISLCLLMSASVVLAAADNVAERIQSAQSVFSEIMTSPDKGIPRDLLAKAHCIVIVPSMKRGGFILGAQYGVGVASCREADNYGWSAPSTVKIEGGSIGAQIGGGETDVIMMVMNSTGAEKLIKSEFALGAEGSVMAGPVGRSATAETDAYLRAEILSYSRSRGLFAGVVLKGTTLRSDDDKNKELYGKAVSHADILHGKVAATKEGKMLVDTLTKESRSEQK